MISLEKANDEFIKYVQQFDITNDDIKRKIGHSFRVENISKILAKNLNLSEKEINIATLIRSAS